MGMIEMKVEDDGKHILSYRFKTIGEASEMFLFLKGFFPDGTFIIQPLRQ
jgi:hypothetical protein